MRGSFGRVGQHMSFYRGLRGFLGNRTTPVQAKALLKERLARRETAFLTMVEHKIFADPDSPYHPLLRNAGCTWSDIVALVRTDGMEGALKTLYRAGVYFSFDEFKGRSPVRRGGLEFRVDPARFDNKHLKRFVTRSTSGTSGAGVRVTMSLDHIAATNPYLQVARLEDDFTPSPRVLWLQGFPGFLGAQIILRTLLAGDQVAHWFTPRDPIRERAGFKNRLGLELFLNALSRQGAAVPRPEPVPVHKAHEVARAIHATLRRHGRCLFSTYLGLALCVCAAARDRGLDMTGCTFNVGGEPLTPGKAALIKATGGEISSSYSTTETSLLGLGCRNPADVSELHFFSDAHALIQNRRAVPGWDIEVDAFCFTSLLPSAPKVMLNVESDDYGVMEERSCGCLWEKLGFTTHLRNIYSYRKLTGNGVSLVGSDALHLLDAVLPARYGGGPQDYQLCESERKGRTVIELVVSPRLNGIDEDELRQTFLSAIKGALVADPATADMWRDLEAVHVVRRAPALNGRGKIMPLHLDRLLGSNRDATGQS